MNARPPARAAGRCGRHWLVAAARKVAGSMNVKWERRDGTALARVEGRIDGANFSEFQRVLEAGLEPDADSVVLDFEHVAFISSAGLRVVLMLGKQLRKRGAQLALFSLKHRIREIFAVSGFDRVVPIHGSESQAIDSARRRSAAVGERRRDAEERDRLRHRRRQSEGHRGVHPREVRIRQRLHAPPGDAPESAGTNQRGPVAVRRAVQTRAAHHPQEHVPGRIERARRRGRFSQRLTRSCRSPRTSNPHAGGLAGISDSCGQPEPTGPRPPRRRTPAARPGGTASRGRRSARGPARRRG